MRMKLWFPLKHTFSSKICSISGIMRHNVIVKLFCVLCVSLCQAVNTVQQTLLIVQEEEKKSYLFDFIRSMQPMDKVLVFVGKKLM